ncbi:MAG: M28 family peptidase [Gemmatimonadaceae bacterium]
MRKAALALLLLAACERGGPRPGKFDGESAVRYAKAQLDFGTRVPGTAGAQRAGDWIVARMRERADTVIVQSWEQTLSDGRKLPLRNVLARFRPDLPDRVLYLVHWDTRPLSDGAEDPAQRNLPMPGANDGASGVGLLVALGDALKKTPPAVGVDLLFVDGEDYGDFGSNKDVLMGSTYFASHLPTPTYRPIFGVLWDMIGDKDLRIKQEQNSVSQAPEVVRRVWQQAAELGHDDVFVEESTGYPITDDHIPLLQAGLRVIDVIDLDYPYHHRPSDTLDKISARSLSIVGEVAEALLR